MAKPARSISRLYDPGGMPVMEKPAVRCGHRAVGLGVGLAAEMDLDAGEWFACRSVDDCAGDGSFGLSADEWRPEQQRKEELFRIGRLWCELEIANDAAIRSDLNFVRVSRDCLQRIEGLEAAELRGVDREQTISARANAVEIELRVGRRNVAPSGDVISIAHEDGEKTARKPGV